jgi:predicted GNAT family acetyltransferase
MHTDTAALDRPVWASLTTHHADIALRDAHGGALARRYPRDVNLFASACDDSEFALRALADLIAPGHPVYVLQAPPIVLPPGCHSTRGGRGVQMLSTRDLRGDGAREFERGDLEHHDLEHHDIRPLGDADAPEMVALAQLTQPGPFLARTHTMGRFLGVRIDGRLAAMAGERMRFPGHTEVSGVCVHPDFRGRGLARRLSTVVAARIQARGDRPFLHAWADNRAAIALYETLGFVLRCEVEAKILEREGWQAVEKQPASAARDGCDDGASAQAIDDSRFALAPAGPASPFSPQAGCRREPVRASTGPAT